MTQPEVADAFTSWALLLRLADFPAVWAAIPMRQVTGGTYFRPVYLDHLDVAGRTENPAHPAMDMAVIESILNMVSGSADLAWGQERVLPVQAACILNVTMPSDEGTNTADVTLSNRWLLRERHSMSPPRVSHMSHLSQVRVGGDCREAAPCAFPARPTRPEPASRSRCVTRAVAPPARTTVTHGDGDALLHAR